MLPGYNGRAIRDHFARPSTPEHWCSGNKWSIMLDQIFRLNGVTVGHGLFGAKYILRDGLNQKRANERKLQWIWGSLKRQEAPTTFFQQWTIRPKSQQAGGVLALLGFNVDNLKVYIFSPRADLFFSGIVWDTSRPPSVPILIRTSGIGTDETHSQAGLALYSSAYQI